MVAPDIEVIEISLLSGRSDRPTMTFVPGRPAPTVSLGTAGQWAIAGDGVGPVHVFVTFDGQSVHVAAAVANLPAALAGAPIGTGWTRAAIPCELRFGGACVILRRTSRPGSFTTDEATVHDGGLLQAAALQRAQQASQPVVDLSQTQQSPTVIPAMRPAAGMPAEATEIVPAPPLAQTLASSGSIPPPIDLTKTTPLADAQRFRDAVSAAQQAAPPRPSELSPETVRQQPHLVPVAVPAEPLGEMEKTMVAPHPPRPPQGVPDMVAAGPPGERPATAMTSPAATPGVAPLPAIAPTSKPPNFWQAASPVKKVTLVLMPFALVMAFLMLRDEPAPPPPRTANVKVRTDGGTVAARSTADAGLAVIPVDAGESAAIDPAGPVDAAVAVAEVQVAKADAKDAKADPKTTPATSGKRTAERTALDAVAAGSFDDAARKYDALVAAHADDPSYKEAARILHEKAGN